MRVVDKCHAGFTLLEALVALILLTGVTASLMTLIAINRRAQSDAEADLSAALQARTILARIGRDLPLEAGTQSGVLEDGHIWSALVTPFELEDGVATAANTALFQVRVNLKRGISGPSLIEVVSLKRASL